MQDLRDSFSRAALWCALGSASAAVASIAASQILLGCGVLALLASRRRWELPPGSWFLAFFVFWTLLAAAVSPEPALAWPQLRKLYVLLALPLLYTTVESAVHARWLAFSWLGLGTLSAAWGLQQFVSKYLAAQAAGEPFYRSYVGARITGFNSHWMTFSGQMMVALLFTTAFVLWGTRSPRRRLLLPLLVILLALVLAFTRGVWIATAAGALWLLWSWRKWAVLLLPAAGLIALAVGPESLRTRTLSIVRPQGAMDSNQHRIATFETGLQMIRAHPLFGVGPERVGREFQHYVPKHLLPLPEGFYGHLHNIYVQYAAERGIPAMLALISFLVCPLLLWIRGTARGGETVWILHGGIAVLIGILITGVFEHNLGDSEILMLALSVIAIASRIGLRPGGTIQQPHLDGVQNPPLPDLH